MANTLPLIEVDYYNAMWNKSVITPQPEEQTNDAIVPGTGRSAANLGTWPINNVFAPPLTVNPGFGVDGSDNVGTQDSVSVYNFYTEEMFIRGGFNNASMSYGVRAYLDEDEPVQQHRFNALIYSGVFNSRTGLNRTNEFPVGTNITKAANPQYGSIQKIYAEENNLIVLQENKCSRALIDKDAIYNAEGGGSVTTQRQVLGEIVPYTGEYGISKNPESFAIYAYRKYFVDRNRNAVLRLSHDGITEISEYGMRDWFRDNLADMNDEYTNEFTYDLNVSNIATSQTNDVSYFAVTTSPVINKASIIPGSKIFWSDDEGDTFEDTTAVALGYGEIGATKVIFTNKILDSSYMDPDNDGRLKLVAPYRSRAYGGWDAYNKQYIVSLQYNRTKTFTPDDSGSSQIPNRNTTHYTLGYDEQVRGWPSFYSYMPALIGSLKNTFLTVNNQPYSPANDSDDGDVAPTQSLGLYKHYQTSVAHAQFYNTDNAATVSIVANSNPSLQKNFLTIDYEGDSGWKASVITSDRTGENLDRGTGGTPTGGFSFERDDANIIRSYVEGAYDSAGNTGTSANPVNAPLLRAGFDRKENRYVANFVNNSTQGPGEIVYGNQVSGLKGFYLDITFSTDDATAPGNMKELYSIGVNYNVSSR
tara:strand:+ start:1621 stop:3555 length:1935 start_codon:yes stop_codon:yes gene_type:complete